MTSNGIPSRTLVVGPNWVGDTVMAQPVFAALAASGREVHVLARPHLHPLLEMMPAVQSAVLKSRDRETVARLRRGGYEEAILLPDSFRSAWLPFRAGIRRRRGYRSQYRTLLLTDSLRRPSRRGRRHLEDYRELLEAAGVALPEDWTPRLEPSAGARRSGDEALRRARIEPGAAPLVGLFPGAEFGPSKRWPWSRFAELSHALRRRRGTARLVIVAGPQEVWLAVKIYEAAGKVAPVVGSDLDLAGLAGLLARLDLLITNDSGPMHLAAALGVPCVALFGPTDPARTAPAGEGHRVLYTDRWCAPCYRKRCPLLHHRCMKEIGVEEVADAAAELLAEAPSG